MNAGLASEPGGMSKKRFLVVAGSATAGLGVVMGLCGWLLAWHKLGMLGLVLVLVGAIWLVCSYFACDEPMRPVHRRYLREFFPAMAAYMILLFVALPLLDRIEATWLKVVVALLPVLPIVWLLRAVLRFLLGSDELEQKIQLQAIAIAAMSVALLSFAAAFLQIAGVMALDNGLIWVLPALFGVYGLAMAWVKRGYGGE